MDVEFADKDLARLETDAGYNAGFAPEIVRGFRLRIQFIRAAVDERDFYSRKSYRYEKLKGNRTHQHSIRINDQWRLILEFRTTSSGKTVIVVSIEDYH